MVNSFKYLMVHGLCLCLMIFSSPVCLLAQEGEDQSVANDISSNIDQLKQQVGEIKISDELKDYLTNPTNYVSFNLSENDRQALRLLGYSEAEINSLSFSKDELNKLSDRADTYLDKKSAEVEDGAMKDLIPGLTSSVIGLGLASVLGVVVGVKCRNIPSALAFAGTSAAWAGLEMSIWKGYRINMDDIKTLQEAGKIPDKIKADIDKIKSKVKQLTADFKVSGLDDFEDFLKNKEAEVKEIKALAVSLKEYLRTIKDKQFGSIRSLQKSLELAAETSSKKARNAKIAAIGYAASAGVATAEAFSVFGAVPTCVGVTTYSPLKQLLDLLIPQAVAGFANVADLDKIGIPVGAGLGAAYVAFEAKFADKIYASATSRAIVFTGMAGLAYFASAKLDEASQFLKKQAQEMDIFATVVEDALEGKQIDITSGSELVRSLKEDLLPQIETLVEKVKDEIPDTKEILALAEGEAKEKVAEKKSEAEVKLARYEDQIKAELALSSEEIEKSIGAAKTKVDVLFEKDELIPNLKETTWVDWLIPSAHAALPTVMTIPRSCFTMGRPLPVMDEKCECAAKQNCLRAFFPTNLQLQTQKEYGAEVVKTALLVSKANNLTLSRRPDQASAIIKAVEKNIGKLEVATAQLLTHKAGSAFTPKHVASLVTTSIGATREALAVAFADGGTKMVTSIPSRQNSVLGERLAEIKRENVRVKLKNDARLSASLSDYREVALDGVGVASELDRTQDYNYSRNTIIEDTTRDLFETIKLRYLKLYTSGRLKLDEATPPGP